MLDLDDRLVQDYLVECGEHVATIETELSALEKGETEMYEDRIRRVFHAVHAIQVGGFFKLVKIRDLARQMEVVITETGAHKEVPKPECVRVLLCATSTLRELIQTPATSNLANTAEISTALKVLLKSSAPLAGQGDDSGAQLARGSDRRMRVLLAEDDFTSRRMLKTFLSRYGECDVAVNGREAVEAVRSALELTQRYDLICMDIMMPEMDGREAVRQVRAMEEANGIFPPSGAKIIMTTAVNDMKEVMQCFKDRCDAYLLKPVDLRKLLDHMKSFQLVA